MRTRSRRGVTLIELMVVVLIIAAVTAMAVPNFLRWSANERVKSAARSASDAFVLARSEALRTGNTHLVVFANALGAPTPIAVVDDGPDATSNCTIDAGEVVHSVSAEPDVSWGTSTGAASGTPVPEDKGKAPGSAPAGSTFTDADGDPATWILFRADGLPRTFTPGGGGCSAIGDAGEGGGGIYVTNGERDYAAVLAPLGTARVHKWQPGGSWSD